MEESFESYGDLSKTKSASFSNMKNNEQSENKREGAKINK